MEDFSPDQLARKVVLGEELLTVISKIDPGKTQWRGELLCGLGIPVMIRLLQELRDGSIEEAEFKKRLVKCVGRLEEAVACLEGEPYVGYEGLKDRIKELCKLDIIGSSYTKLLRGFIQLPFL